MKSLRFFQHPRCEPSFNMAFDEWMLDRATNAGEVLCRLYTWCPPAITIGRHQRAERAVDFQRLNGTEVIRRVTGGRAIYHDPSELTYSVAFPIDGCALPALAGTVMQTSRQIAGMMTSFVNRLGIEARIANQSSTAFRQRGGLHTAPCFESTARFEVEGGGRKLVASAQYRNDRALLQHGSVKLNGVADHAALQSVSSGGLNPDRQWNFDQAADLFVASAENFFGLSADMGSLNEQERQQVDRAVDRVRHQPLDVRISFKQIGPSVSLLHDRP